jgi:hypothetical protein
MGWSDDEMGTIGIWGSSGGGEGVMPGEMRNDKDNFLDWS